MCISNDIDSILHVLWYYYDYVSFVNVIKDRKYRAFT